MTVSPPHDPASPASSAPVARAAPVSATERVEALDVLRGLALFGVFWMNLTGFAGRGLMATDRQLLELPTAALDLPLVELGRWLGMDKANTTFAFLFGLGFYLQLQRAEARGTDFEPIYRRRLWVLLFFGTLHLMFLWTWDILHLYALAGFALLALRRSSDRMLLWGGLALSVLGRVLQETYTAFVMEPLGFPNPYGAAAVLARQKLAAAGDYPGLVVSFAEFTWIDWLVGGGLLSWIFYALGRFMLGAWVGRRGWMQNTSTHLAGFRRVLRWTLPAGLILEGLWRLGNIHGRNGVLPTWPHWHTVAEGFHFVAVPVLAAGYICAAVVGLHTQLGRQLLAPFAPVGQMALTNYATQSFVYGFVLFKIGPGLGLAGKIGFTLCTAIVIVGFALQMILSRWWLARFRFGPLEWAWRGLTYGAWPTMRLHTATALASAATRAETHSS